MIVTDLEEKMQSDYCEKIKIYFDVGRMSRQSDIDVY